MTFNEYLEQAWTDHADDSAKVAQTFSTGISLIDKNEQIPQMAMLVTHVCGEHLHDWEKGLTTLESLKKISAYVAGSEAEKALKRSTSSLQVASGKKETVDELSVSDQVRVFAVATSAVSGADIDRAQSLFKKALEKAQQGLVPNDPAIRSLAVTGNTLAESMESKENLSKSEKELMILAAKTGRKYWEMAGTWMNVERAEYRLTKSYLAAKEPFLASEHAKNCLDVCEKNNAPAMEFFFGYEAMALAEYASGNFQSGAAAVQKAKEYLGKVSAEEKPWCEPALQKLLGAIV